MPPAPSVQHRPCLLATTNHLDRLISPLGGLQSTTVQEGLTHLAARLVH